MHIFLSFLSYVRILTGLVLLSTVLPAQTLNTLYNFGFPAYEGTHPSAGVIVASQGQLYGTTNGGGNWNLGSVYELLPPASPGAARTEMVLHSFYGPEGEYPIGGLVMDTSGALYGVTTKNTTGYGTAFQLEPPTSGSTPWTLTVIYEFTESDGNPSGGLVFCNGPGLYGLTEATGLQKGTVYRLTPPSTGTGVWTKTTLYSFPGGTGGWDPVGRLAVGSNGTLFGVTRYGGKPAAAGDGGGTVFSLARPTSVGGAWAEKLLYEFNSAAGDGIQPVAGLTIAPSGVLYGTTTLGGAAGSGTVFALSPPAIAGEPMTETILYSFTGLTGSQSGSALVLWPNRVLFGTTATGGANNDGMVFELKPPASAGEGWTEKTLYDFTGGTDGSGPSGLAAGSAGALYGTAANGGVYDYGTVFAITP